MPAIGWRGFEAVVNGSYCSEEAVALPVAHMSSESMGSCCVDSVYISCFSQLTFHRHLAVGFMLQTTLVCAVRIYMVKALNVEFARLSVQVHSSDQISP